MRQRLHDYALLMRLDKPVGTFLLLWPTVWALLIAGHGHPDGRLVLIFIAGVLLMRAAGCVVNDLADRDFDPHVARTRHRPLAAGRVSRVEAILLFCVLTLAAFGLVLLTNRLTVYLSLAGVFLAATYPFIKRFSYIPQVYLGMAFGWAIPMTFAAQTGSVSAEAGLLYVATILWAVAYDTIYAMVDREDDLKIGIKSTAILFGEYDRLAIGIVQVLFFIALMLVGHRAELGAPYYVCLGIVAGLMIWQQFLIRNRDPEGCFRAFLNNTWIGVTVAIGIAASYLFSTWN
ncbi:MAG: 4-hydroxybenzoate octaprenyltransferase [Gammaproteobacteria bacterium]|nr:MAG: 4-hydroxybenzoate octaprenyltransferase [Gammaproteobacteria bacterium]